LNLPRRCHFERAYDFLQHFAQPAVSVQHLVQVAWSLQHEPSHAVAVLVLAPLLQQAQPVVISKATAKTAARIMVVFIFCFMEFFRSVFTKSIWCCV
jgi:hypothetical protein